MSFNDIRRVLQEHPSRRFGAGASDDEIGQAEIALEVEFPDSYRLFLAEFGWGGAGDFDLFGLGTDVLPGLNVVEVTISERSQMMPLTPKHLVPVMNDGGGNLYCLDTQRISADGDCPVVIQDHALDEIDHISDSFLTWLEEWMEDA